MSRKFTARRFPEALIAIFALGWLGGGQVKVGAGRIGLAGAWFGAEDAMALEYSDASPSGAQFPHWDGGNTELEFADINADGEPDLLSIGDHGSPYVNTQEHGIMVYYGNGAGAWTLHMEGDFGYGGIALGDLNNDGKLDAAYAMHHNYSGNDFGDQLIEAALGDGTGASWTPWDDGLATNGEDYGMAAVDLADMDNDGDLDLVAHSFGCCNGLHVYRNNGDGTWTQTWALTGGNAQCFVSWGDVNGDGFPDFAASYQNGTVFLGDGSGLFTRADTGLPAPGSSGLKGVALGDVDGDGRADLAFCKGGGVFVYLWRVDHWESSSTGLPSSGNTEVTQLYDMNSDGNVDLVAMGLGTCTIWLGDGAGHWSAGGGFHQGSPDVTNALRVGSDIDHNGLPDLAFVQEEGSFPSYQNKLFVFREASIPSARAVTVDFPRGNEIFSIGSVQTIRWCSAHLGATAATITLELSTSGPGGPWQPVARNIPDSGHWQWITGGSPTDDALLRITLDQDGEQVSAQSRPFRLLPGGSAAVPDPLAVARESRLRLAAFPNPFLESTRFSLWPMLPGAGPTPVDPSAAGAPGGRPWRVTIQDPSGRVRRTLFLSGAQGSWNGGDDSGRRLPAGVYLAAAKRGGEMTRPLRLILVR